MLKLSWILALFAFQSVLSQTNNVTEDATSLNHTRVRIVLLKTSDVVITENDIVRLREIGLYTENYYWSELTSHGYSLSNTTMFARNTDDEILIYVMESSLSSDDINGNNIVAKAKYLMSQQHPDITDLNTIWAIAHLKDGGGFVGSGSVEKGKMRFQLKDAIGNIDFSKHMSETDYHRDISLKAILHELGHALTVWHNGPLRSNTDYNTLMGPTNNAYENTVGISQTNEVRLSPYTAAIIAYHPLFNNTTFDTSELEDKTMRIDPLKGDPDLFTIDCLTGKLRLRGKLTSNFGFHHIVVRFSYGLLSSSGYWNSSFAIPTDLDGTFDIEFEIDNINTKIIENDEVEYELMVVFNNGLSRGVTQLGRDEMIEINKNTYVRPYSTITEPTFIAQVLITDMTLWSSYTGGDYYQWIDCDDNFKAIEGAVFSSYNPITSGNYAVKIQTPGGCTFLSDCIRYSLLENPEISDQKIEIYPNPNEGKFYIESKNGGIDQITVYDLFGKKIITKQNKKKYLVEFNINRRGLYFIKIIAGQKKYLKKVMVR